MIDAVNAVSVPMGQVQAWDTLEIADPDSVGRFEQAFMEGENIVKPPGFADRVLENIINIDSGYQRLFPDGIDRMPRASVTLDPLTKPVENPSSSASSGGLDFAASFKLVEEAHAWSIGVLSWTTQLKLMTTTVTTGTKGMSTLLKSGGG